MTDTKKIDVEKIVKHWIDSSEKDFQTMLHLYESKDNHWALFLGHVVVKPCGQKNFGTCAIYP